MKKDITPLVSVLIPCYNHEGFIIECLDSIIRDSYSNKEICIIDDGSTDNSIKLIILWIEKNRKILNINFKYRKNLGVTKTLNELIELANGDFITFLASDDKLSSESIYPRVDFLLNNNYKQAVIGDSYIMDENSKTTYKSALFEFYKGNKKNYQSDEGICEEIISNWGIPGPVLLVRITIFDTIGKFDETLKVEDWDFYLRMVSKNLLGFIDVPVAYYRVHSTNVSFSCPSCLTYDLLKSILKNIKLFRWHYKLLCYKIIFTKALNKIIQKIYK